MAGRKQRALRLKTKIGKKVRNKINDRENDRLGSHNVARTKHFWQGQKFGSASPCYRIDPVTGEKTVVEVTKRSGVKPPKKRRYIAKPDQYADRDPQMRREASERWGHLRGL